MKNLDNAVDRKQLSHKKYPIPMFYSLLRKVDEREREREREMKMVDGVPKREVRVKENLIPKVIFVCSPYLLLRRCCCCCFDEFL